MNIRILGKPKTLPLSGHSPLGFAVRIAVALGCGILAAGNDAALAITLDGTSGTNTSSAPLSTTGNLQINLGFFAEYLIVGGGGAGAVTRTSGGGGGAGGLLTGSTTLGASSHSVTVGGGGTSLANQYERLL